MEKKGKGAVAKCGLNDALVFLVALISGTLCSLFSKIMMMITCEGMTGQMQSFSNPLFQTMAMMFGMMMGLPMHYAGWCTLYS